MTEVEIHNMKTGNVVKNKKKTYKPVIIKKTVAMRLPEEVLDSFIALSEKNLKDLRTQYIAALVNSGKNNTNIVKSTIVLNDAVKVVIQKPKAKALTPRLATPKIIKAPPVENSLLENNMPPAELLERLLELKPFAQQVRSSSPMYRAEAEEYSYLINQANTVYHVSMYRLAKLLGVTTSALAFRLVRYGYKTSEGKNKVYTKVKHRSF